jgi:fibronectin type 3 domain-containing protein
VVDSPDGKKTLELPGETSASIRVDVIDTFPPAIPTGLVAVAAVEEKTIDLSWQSDTEEDLAGYIVYRASDTSETWVRISGAQPVIGPAYPDASAQPGQTYRYAVSAIDLTGHESKRSAEARESLPNP